MIDFRARGLTVAGRLADRQRLVGGVVLAILAGLVAMQAARLIWTLVMPLGPVGDWRATVIAPGAWPQANGAPFDPFFRSAPAAATSTVTSLAIKLYGTRIGGLGSAIIATPDGVQSSFSVGEEIMPGVVLKSVAFDSVTVTQNGRDEIVFIDQSTPAAPGTVPPPVSTAPGAPAPPTAAMTPAATGPINQVADFSPRFTDGKPSGLTISPKGDGAAFRAAGLEPGDVVVAVNGRPVTAAGDLSSLAGASEAILLVERAGRTVSVPVRPKP